MSNIDVQLREEFQWFKRPPIWWDPVPDWLNLRDELRHKLFVTELRAQLEIQQIQMRALEEKIGLIEQGLG